MDNWENLEEEERNELLLRCVEVEKQYEEKRKSRQEENAPLGNEMKKIRKSCISLAKVISGGQSGADRAALEVAERVGLLTGGTAPPQYMTSDGPRPELGTRFHLEELKISSSKLKCDLGECFVMRSRKNVDESDATVAFRTKCSAGTDKTIGYCLTKQWKVIPEKERQRLLNTRQCYRPVLVICLNPILPSQSSQSSLMCHNPPEHHQIELTGVPQVWREDIDRFERFLQTNNVKILNVCGHREKNKDQSWSRLVRDFLWLALSNCEEHQHDLICHSDDRNGIR